VIKTVRLEKKA